MVIVLAFGLSVVSSPCALSAPSQLFLSDLLIPTYVWNTSSPKAIVLGLHGGCLHGRSFASLAKAMQARDFTFVSLDMRGFGRWYHEHYGTERDTTFHYDDTVNDIEKVLLRLHKRYPRTPIYALGESLGANVAILIGARNPTLVDGIIAISLTTPRPFFSPRMVPNTVQALVAPTSKLDLSPYLDDRLAVNPKEAQAQINDPMSRDEQSMVELLKTMAINREGKRAAKDLPSAMPLLFISGGQDKLSSTRRSLKYLRKLPMNDMKLVTFPDRGHLMVETRSVDSAVFNMIVGWLQTHSRTAIASRPLRQPL